MMSARPSDDEMPLMAATDLMLAWADAHHPEAASATRAVVRRANVLAVYLARLIEVRAEREPAWFRSEASVRLLDWSGLVVTVRHRPTGQVLRVGGRACREDVQFRFLDLTRLTPDGLTAFLPAVELFDGVRT